MANRQVYPSSLFPLRGDISAEAGATTVTVTGLQGIPIISPPVEPVGGDTLFYDDYNNDWYYASPWSLPVGTVLEWEGYGYSPAGISWLAPDTLAVGNGTPGDVSGAVAMTGLVLFGPSTYGAPYGYDYDTEYGPAYDQYYTTFYSGATQDWSLTFPAGPGTSGQVLTTNGSGVTYWSNVSSGSGSVTSFSAGNIGTIITTSVATATTTPALTFALATQAANTFWGGPTSGAAATPTFRVLGITDIPSLSSLYDVSGAAAAALVSAQLSAASLYLPLLGGTMTGVLTLEASAAGLKDATGSAGSNGNVLAINSSGYPVWAAPATSGTVTSVSLGAPTGFTITGSPVTGSGTLAFVMPTGWATGALLLGNGVASVASLGIGSTGNVLTVSGGTAIWTAPAATAYLGWFYYI